MRIGVIDSGVGGLSILNEVRRLVPAHYIYMMDNRYLPYGDKSERFIQERLAQLSSYLIAQGAELILIACNTATTQAVATLRTRFPLPFVGTVPAIKPAAELFGDRGFSVLATPGTCQSRYLADLLTEFAADSPVSCFGSRELVRLAELKVWYQQDVRAEVHAELLRLGVLSAAPKALVLGCTHFPFLEKEIAHDLPHTTLLDTAKAVARRVVSLVEGSALTETVKEDHQGHFISSSELDEKQRLRLSSLGFDSYSCWPELAID